ncbi:MAG: hypothetical protein ABIJ84_01900 [bacterium]
MGVFIQQIRKFFEENPGTITPEEQAELETQATYSEEGYIPTSGIVRVVGYPTAMLIEFYTPQRPTS